MVMVDAERLYENPREDIKHLLKREKCVTQVSLSTTSVQKEIWESKPEEGEVWKSKLSREERPGGRNSFTSMKIKANITE